MSNRTYGIIVAVLLLIVTTVGFWLAALHEAEGCQCDGIPDCKCIRVQVGPGPA